MKFGIALTTPYDRATPAHVGIEEHQHLVTTARDLGFDFFTVGQHFLSSTLRYLQPVPYLAHLATIAPEMRAVTGVLLLPLLHPVEVAENMATLDVLTRGRSVMGVGIGYADLEFDAFDVDRRTRARRYEESIELIRMIWSGDEVHHRGEHWAVDAPPNSMLPERPGGPPIWMAGQTLAAVRRAARLGDTWYVPPFPTHDDLHGLRRAYLEEREARGRGVEVEFPVRRDVFIAPTVRAALERIGPAVQARFETYVRWGMREGSDVGGGFSKVDEDALASRFIVGPPEACAEAIAGLVEQIGMTTLAIKPQWPGLDPDESLRQLELFGEHVMPLVAGL